MNGWILMFLLHCGMVVALFVQHPNSKLVELHLYKLGDEGAGYVAEALLVCG